MIRVLRQLPAVAGALVIAACAPCPYPQTQPAPDVAWASASARPAETPRVRPADSVRVVEVEMRTTREGAAGEFGPREVHVRQGDLLRFRMADGDGHHNISFAHFNDPTPGVRLPPDSPYLTNAGQSWQVRVDLPPGTYRFACIPHHDTQVGTLIVEP
jgi:plastocyanin